MTTPKDPINGHNPFLEELQQKVDAAQTQRSEVEALQAKVAELTEQLQKATEVASRSVAELQNVKERLLREAAEVRKYASESVLLKLLPTIDNLQRALKHLPADLASHEWVRGVIALEQELLKQVGDMGLKRFESLGSSIDTARHEVLMQVPGEEGKVIEVLEDGYELHGKVVRVARVNVGGA